MYKIELKPSAHRALRRLASRMRRSEWEALQLAIDALAEMPRPIGAIKLSGADLYRLRVSDYRVVYAIDDRAQKVTITKIARRSETTYCR